ncbi:MAG: DUF2950 domain-containing protein [Syntrophorhabdales bacterium]
MSRFRDAKEKGLFVIAAVLVIVFACGSAHAKSPRQKSFSSPGEAVKAMADAVKADDTKALLGIFGPGSKDIVLSGDPVEDKEGHRRFVKRYEEKSRLEDVSGKVMLYTGNDEWPFPIPIVKAGSRWIFDTKAGRQEILARRVGRNELNAIQVCLAYVDAQQEYAMQKGRQGKGLLEYAQKFVSAPGAHDGLYWEAMEGQEQSPMGPMFASAREAGYGGEPLGGESAPYHGYFYRILKTQGKDAPGGARDYVVGGKMIGGFAIVAYPAKYGSSGVMTFIVNQDGIVYQKDLGKDSKHAALAMNAFDPDKSWVKVPQ